MINLKGERGWEYAYKKHLEAELARCHDTMEQGQDKDLAFFQYLCGKIHGIREAISLLGEVREKFNVDGDADRRE